MSARLLTPKSALNLLMVELRYTLSRCKADPIAQSCVPVFQLLHDECKVVMEQELDLQEQAAVAQAAVDIADENIDDFSSRLSKALLIIVKDDKTHPLYLHFFGNKSLSLFVKPKLGVQLTATRPWVKDLQTSPFPALQAMAPELIGLIDAADQALTARSDIQAQNRSFRDVGARQQLFDKVNGARKTADGELTKIAIDTPGLPTDYSSKFFRTATAEQDQNAPTIQSVTDDISELDNKLAAATALLDQLKKAAADAKLADEQTATDEKELQDLEQQEEAVAKKKAALKKKLGKKK